jgi:hypothetical protein
MSTRAAFSAGIRRCQLGFLLVGCALRTETQLPPMSVSGAALQAEAILPKLVAAMASSDSVSLAVLFSDASPGDVYAKNILEAVATYGSPPDTISVARVGRWPRTGDPFPEKERPYLYSAWTNGWKARQNRKAYLEFVLLYRPERHRFELRRVYMSVTTD